MGAIKEMIKAPGKSLSLISKFLSVANLIVGEVMVGMGLWSFGVWDVIIYSVALAVLSLPVDISIILKNLNDLKNGAAGAGK